MNASTVTASATHRDPAWLHPARYVDFLNQAFPGQWNRASYDWYIARGFNNRNSELLVRTDGTRLVAGMTLCYRQVEVGSEPPVEVCVLSAGGTLPSERGTGHYHSLLLAALEHVGQGPCAALLGFVTRQNGSGRGLLRLGASAIPSYYIVTPDRALQTPAPRFWRRRTATDFAGPRPRQVPDAALATLSRSRPRDSGSAAAGLARFHYERREDWAQQFIHRPHPVRTVRLGHDSLALLEAVGDTDRLQWLACPDYKRIATIAALAAASAAARRKFFHYTLDPHEAAAARRLGLAVRDGYLMLLPTDRSGARWRRFEHARWSVQSGDRL